MLTPLDPIRQHCGPLRFDPAPALDRFRRRTLARGEAWMTAGTTARRLALVVPNLRERYGLRAQVDGAYRLDSGKVGEGEGVGATMAQWEAGS